MTGEESSAGEPHQGGGHPVDTPLEVKELDQQGQKEEEGLIEVPDAEKSPNPVGLLIT